MNGRLNGTVQMILCTPTGIRRMRVGRSFVGGCSSVPHCSHNYYQCLYVLGSLYRTESSKGLSVVKMNTADTYLSESLSSSDNLQMHLSFCLMCLCLNGAALAVVVLLAYKWMKALLLD